MKINTDLGTKLWDDHMNIINDCDKIISILETNNAIKCIMSPTIYNHLKNLSPKNNICEYGNSMFSYNSNDSDGYCCRMIILDPYAIDNYIQIIKE